MNQIGYDAGNVGPGSITDGRIAPWVQDIEDPSVWASWRVNYRDVIVLNGDRRAVYVSNLSNEGLQIPDNYCNLASVFVAVDRGADEQAIDALPFDGSCPPGVERPLDP